MTSDASVTGLTILLAIVGGNGIWQLLKFLTDWWTGRAKAKRDEVDRATKLARDAELRVRLLTESLHDHRNAMLESKLWTRDTLPPFIKE